jgi:alginate O-acetyltransferase complex protein AlgI
MLFNSFNFLLFFPVVTILYFLLPHAARWFMLLAASCIFYMCFIPKYILILFFTIIIDYFAGILIDSQTNSRKRKAWLITSLVANIGVLAVFKYFNFFISNIDGVAHFFGWNYSIPLLNIVLPIGLSFHTFQAMSYTIEVYRGNQKAERHFGIYALYVMYYPQLVAGPIERPQNLLWQFHKKHTFDYDRVTTGLRLMAWGLFKKVVVADRLSVFVNQAYDKPEHMQGITLLIATIFFSIQIYCDFSGYSDIARGASKVMGIELMHNFRQPYFSRSISEFWKRWHISLSSWFKDYLYIPLGGNRVSTVRLNANLFIVFLVSGLWHGASWTFIIWGAIHGCYLVFANATHRLRQRINTATGLTKLPRVHKISEVIIVFLLVSFAWIFFRAENLHAASLIIRKIFIEVPQYFYRFFTDGSFLWLEPLVFGRDYHLAWFEFAVVFAAIFLLFFADYLHSVKAVTARIFAQPVTVRFSLYFGLVLMIILFGVYHTNSEFIYFQF